MDAGAGWAAIALQTASLVATGVGTAKRIDEGISDYNAEIARTSNQLADRRAEVVRQLKVSRNEEARVFKDVKQEGVLSLREQSAQAGFESRAAFTQAEGFASSEEARLGASGVRASGSPLLAAQQNVDLAFAAADRTAERGSAGVRLGGVRLGNQLGGVRAQGEIQRGGITGQQTLVTREANRRIAEQARKRNELQSNRTALIAIAAAGGAAGLASTFYQINAQTPLFNSSSGGASGFFG